MFGLWKENVSSYNDKDTYRKSTTRKHNIKAKARVYFKKFNLDKRFGIDDSLKFHYNKELVIKEKEIIKSSDSNISKVVKVYNALIKYPAEYSDWGGITKYAVKNILIYEFKSNDWYVVSKHYNYFIFGKDIPLDIEFNSFEIIQLTETKFIKDLSEIKFTKKYFKKYKHNLERFSSYNEKIFMFNKPVTFEADLNTAYRSSNRRKDAKKMVNRKDRSLCRQYISNQDWDKEIKTHSYSKSIAWYID